MHGSHAVGWTLPCPFGQMYHQDSLCLGVPTGVDCPMSHGTHESPEPDRDERERTGRTMLRIVIALWIVLAVSASCWILSPSG